MYTLQVPNEKGIFLVLVCFLLTFKMNAQFVSQFSQYMFAKESYNPAALAEYSNITLNGIYKLQWIGISGAPVDANFHGSIPFAVKNKEGNIGISFDNESLGLFNKQEAEIQGAYKMNFANGTLSLGLNIGAIKIGFSGDSAHIPTGVYGNDYHIPASSDPLIPTSQVYGMALDLGLGAFYYSPKMYVGISALNINEPTVQWSSTQSTYVGNMYYLMGGYNIALANPNFILKPSVLIKTDFVNMQSDIDLLMDYKEKFWGGLAYRINDSFVFTGGVNLSNGLSIGYAFDLPITALVSSSFGSHELMISYHFNFSFAKKRNKYKSVRIL
ncbi:PorP/SprF family type IX secretion system membrane protein [Microbacter margulisiae]|uniref:Type IX secretion system PorP/SprF family membrane protein n=1 Tax=Microbacter margulisiae TaxID=1350067 RepID=A0A7W5H207_9PORP|nr:PorP/SprF family type IX secretion system membrane protein [Microbacter margulisiae]MBB3186936.1 type IX secretion system PorP/SprF family membrane protein [Microbacter margulisiae]